MKILFSNFLYKKELRKDLHKEGKIITPCGFVIKDIKENNIP